MAADRDVGRPDPGSTPMGSAAGRQEMPAASPAHVAIPIDMETRIDGEQVRLLLSLGEASRYTVFGAVVIVGLAFAPHAPFWTIAW